MIRKGNNLPGKENFDPNKKVSRKDLENGIRTIS